MKRSTYLFLVVLTIVGIGIGISAASTDNNQNKVSYRIVGISKDAKAITYNGKICKVNDIIEDFNKIHFNSKKDALKLKNLSTKELLTYPKRDKDTGSTDTYGTYNKNRLSSRDPLNPDKLLKDFFNIDLYEEQHFDTGINGLITDDSQWYELEFVTPDSIRRCRLETEDPGELIVYRDFFEGIDSDTIKASLYQVTPTDTIRLIKKDSITIILHPLDNK